MFVLIRRDYFVKAVQKNKECGQRDESFKGENNST